MGEDVSNNAIPRILKFLRAQAGMTQENLAARLNVSTSLIAKFETSRLVPMPDTAAQIDEAFNSGTLVQETADDARKSVVAEEWVRPWFDLEELATLIRAWGLVLIPGLLQTEAYARALLRAGTGPARDIEESVSVRLTRQQILHREESPARLIAVLDESVLHRDVGGPEVMREQLQAIVTACEQPNVDVHVIPARGPVHAGTSGPFVLATVLGRDVAFIEGPLDGRVHESVEDVARLVETWESVRGYALPVDQSLDLIKKVAEQWT